VNHRRHGIVKATSLMSYHHLAVPPIRSLVPSFSASTLHAFVVVCN